MSRINSVNGIAITNNRSVEMIAPTQLNKRLLKVAARSRGTANEVAAENPHRKKHQMTKQYYEVLRITIRISGDQAKG